jgi:hypothetical protein
MDLFYFIFASFIHILERVGNTEPTLCLQTNTLSSARMANNCRKIFLQVNSKEADKSFGVCIVN